MLGCAGWGWGWDDVLPHFRRSEDHWGGESPLDGAGGEWRVARQRLSWPILQAVHQARAGGEVILSAGALNSPKLLELSGIGQSARLAGLGITPLHDLAEVRENLRPTSVGHVHATTRAPKVQPEIRPNHLSTDNDRSIAVASIRQARAIMTARALAPHTTQAWLPGPGFQTDEALTAKAGDIATTIFHPVGTCRMGADAGSVVDPHLRLRGIAGLRVVDASVMPRVVSGSTATSVVMIAEKAAEMIGGRP